MPPIRWYTLLGTKRPRNEDESDTHCASANYLIPGQLTP